MATQEPELDIRPIVIPSPRTPVDRVSADTGPQVADRPVDDVVVVRQVGRGYVVLRRSIDIAVSCVALLLTLPVMAVLTILIKRDSPGPAIFRQQRVGRDGQPFDFYKFRTMYVDARERFPDMYRYRFDAEQISTFRFKTAEDPRLTPFGRRLRRTSLDELPNLWCVLRGTMTLVGPRPEIPEMVPYYTPSQRAKFAVTPGLTGLAQVSGRNLVPFQQTISDDLRYVASRSLLMDLQILLRTVGVVFNQWGAL